MLSYESIEFKKATLLKCGFFRLCLVISKEQQTLTTRLITLLKCGFFIELTIKNKVCARMVRK